LASRKQPGERRRTGLGRRDFLIKSGEWASAAFLPAALGFLPRLAIQPGYGSSLAVSPDYRLTPHYRAQPPLEDVLRMVEPGFDAFITEKYAEQIEAILANWSAGLERVPADFAPIEACLSAGFMGSILQPSVLEEKRSDKNLTVWRGRFSAGSNGGQRSLGREAFREQLRGLLYSSPRHEVTSSQFLTAEFKLTAITAGDSPASRLQTRIRFDLVQTGARFHRYERVGHWDLTWAKNGSDTWQVETWQPVEETSSMAFAPLYVDVTAQALGRNASYREQLLQGSDYWRTVLDGASHTDVYGNNGIAVADIDDDGFDDLYICQPAGLPNRLYRNRGDGTFEDVTEAAGVGVLDNTACALFADLNNRGRQDLIVVAVDGPLLFLNQGNGRFRFKPDAFRFAQPPQGTFTGAAIADYDRDGLLDVYFCLYSYYLGIDQYHFPAPYYDAQNGPPHFLMHNNGDGTFGDATTASGINQNSNRFGFACGWVDYNQDGWPDLYVANDFGRKNLYRNNGNGTFTDVAREAGVEDVGAGMSVCWFDYDNDGKPDLYVTDMWSAAGKRVSTQDVFMNGAPEEVRALLRKHAEGNSLFHNQGNGRFSDASAAAGVQMGRWSWSGDAWDFDHDGYPDLYVVNGMISGPKRRDLSSFFWRQVVAKTSLNAVPLQSYEQGWTAINELIRADGTWSGYERNNFYANNRDGSFSDVSGTVGLDFVEDGRAFALADYDHDGRQEVFLKNRNGPQLRILHNQMHDLGQSISFRLRGLKSNRDAIGAAITIEAGKLRQTKFVQIGSGFLSQHSKEVFFGLGNSTGPVKATVRWPSGLDQRLEGLTAGNRILIEEGSSQFVAQPFKSDSPGSNRSATTEPVVRLGAQVAPASGADSGAQFAAPLPLRVETWLLVPVVAPDFSLPDVAGSGHTLSSYRGRPVLLSFWVTSSPACEEQLREFEERHKGWAALGFELLTVNLNDPGAPGYVRALVRDKGMSFPVLLGNEETAAIYNILYRYLFDRRRDLELPTSFLIDKQGSIVKVYQGVLEAQHVEQDLRHIPVTAKEHTNTALPFPGDWYGGDFHRNQFTYALVFMERGYLDPAIEACRVVVENDPTSAEAHYLLGSIYLKKQMSQEARENFEQALRLRPSYPDTWSNAWNNLGMLAAQRGESEAAIQNFQEAIRQNPSNVIAIDNLGNVYRQQKRWAEAQATLERALKIDPDDVEANYSLGMVFAQQDDTERAYEYLHRALALRPGFAQALNNLGILFLRTRRPADAIETFQNCIRVAPAFDQAYLNLAKVYVVENHIDQAKAVLRELLAQQPEHALAQKALAELSQR
jgi:tetratricopeptide (TPR) repeat protein